MRAYTAMLAAYMIKTASYTIKTRPYLNERAIYLKLLLVHSNANYLATIRSYSSPHPYANRILCLWLALFLTIERFPYLPASKNATYFLLPKHPYV